MVVLKVLSVWIFLVTFFEVTTAEKTLNTTTFMVWWDKVNLTVYRNERVYSQLQINSGDLKEEPAGTVQFEFKPPDQNAVSIFNLKMTLNKTGGYWSLAEASVDLTVDKLPMSFKPMSSEVTLLAPLGMSFHCSHFGVLTPTVKPNSNYSIAVDLYGFQIQAFEFPQLRVNGFGPAYECVGFFTIGIWSGIFVTIILAAIMTWGLSMIMSVKTMDRFDDPKGKPVSFAGTE